MLQAASTKFFNDSSDLDLPGLEQVKSSFRAIEMNHLYRATVRRGKGWSIWAERLMASGIRPDTYGQALAG